MLARLLRLPSSKDHKASFEKALADLDARLKAFEGLATEQDEAIRRIGRDFQTLEDYVAHNVGKWSKRIAAAKKDNGAEEPDTEQQLDINEAIKRGQPVPGVPLWHSSHRRGV